VIAMLGLCELHLCWLPIETLHATQTWLDSCKPCLCGIWRESQRENTGGGMQDELPVLGWCELEIFVNPLTICTIPYCCHVPSSMWLPWGPCTQAGSPIPRKSWCNAATVSFANANRALCSSTTFRRSWMRASNERLSTTESLACFETM